VASRGRQVGLDDPDDPFLQVVEVELDLVEEEPTDSSPVNCSCLDEVLVGFCVLRRSSVSRKI
jgi:hypothetical protein